MGLTGKRFVSAAVAVPALVLLLAATRTWLTGRSAEPLLGGGAVSATGSQVAPGVVPLALVCVVAMVTALTGGPVVRRISSVVLVLAAIGSLVLTIRPLTDPEAALGRVAAAGLGRTGVVRTSAEVTVWAWIAVVAAAVLVAASLLAVVATRRWSGLSRRFDAPGEGSATPAATEQGARRTTWDDLSEGRDPTLDP
ncbi:MAG TPA: Trp biosynthesis-associated membrane protein [Lapillicoccus sp.]|nr:Trp biosynthesis-associated membrane protein [Lapillicoccus sp.]